jgi:hypothetical protein
MVIYTFLHSLV